MSRSAATRLRHPGDTRDMDREHAETHLRLLAEAELRRAMKMPVGSIPGWWHSARLALVAQALTTRASPARPTSWISPWTAPNQASTARAGPLSRHHGPRELLAACIART